MPVLSDLAAAALDAALAIARAELDGAGDIRLAVIALGKTGARERNYVSAVDVVFVLDSAADEDCRHLATELAQRMRSIRSDAGTQPAPWAADTALRPGGTGRRGGRAVLPVPAAAGVAGGGPQRLHRRHPVHAPPSRRPHPGRRGAPPDQTRPRRAARRRVLRPDAPTRPRTHRRGHPHP